MYIVFRPEGEKERTWEYKPQKLRAAEAEILEKRTGWTFDEFNTKLIQGSTLARRALLWLLIKREHPALKFDDFDFAIGDVEVKRDRVELVEFRAQIEKFPFDDENTRRAAFELIDEEIRNAPGEAEPSDPKAAS